MGLMPQSYANSSLTTVSTNCVVLFVALIGCILLSAEGFERPPFTPPNTHTHRLHTDTQNQPHPTPPTEIPKTQPNLMWFCAWPGQGVLGLIKDEFYTVT